MLIEWLDAVLAVRTFSSTHILGLKHLEASANLTATNLYAITREDLQNETAVDIRHLPSSDVVLAVGDGGTVFACDPTKGAKEMFGVLFRLPGNILTLRS
jgi:hypothetical protein